MFKTIHLLTKKPGMSAEAFRDYYETTHRKFVKHLPGVRRYIRRYVTPLTGEAADHPGFDVIMEMWFDDEDAWRRGMAALQNSPHFEDLCLDEEQLFDRSKIVASRSMRVEEWETDAAELE